MEVELLSKEQKSYQQRRSKDNPYGYFVEEHAHTCATEGPPPGLNRYYFNSSLSDCRF
jgi:hypothetical protein